jgi:uncharacterized protein (TIGR00730 family)
MKTICCFCSSSDAVGKQYFDIANELGSLIGSKRYVLVYGGTTVGLMGQLASSVKISGGKVIGVIPKTMKHVAKEDIDEVIWCKNLKERKEIMQQRSDSFIALPGGFGTLEEVMEILVLKQLNHHNKPVIFLDVNGFFSDLLQFFERIYKERFAKESYREYYHFERSPELAIAFIENYNPPAPESKWF